MKTPEIPANEPARLLKLAEYGVLDTPRETAFDSLVALAANLADVPIALVAFVDAHRVWFKARLGLDVVEQPRELSFCAHVVATEVPLIVPDTLLDERFRDHPMVLNPPHLRFYVGMPLRTPDGFVLGTLCVLDVKPRTLTAAQRDLLRMLAHLAMDELEMRRQGHLLRSRQHALQSDLRHTSDEASRLASILSNAAVAIIETTPDGVIREFNPAAERMLGYTAAEVVGRHSPMIFHDPAELAARANELTVELGVPVQPNFEAFRARVERGMRDEHEWTWLSKDGRRVPVHLSLSARRDVAGQVAGYMGIASDQTARKEAEAKLRQHSAVLQLGSDVARAFTKNGTLQQRLQSCAEAMVTNLDAAFARIWTLDEAQDLLELRASAGQYTHLDGPHSRAPVGKFKIGTIAKSRLPHLTNAVLDDPEVSDREWAQREGMVSFAGYPMLMGERVVGVLAMFARHPLSPTVLEALGVVAANAAVWIDRERPEPERGDRTRPSGALGQRS
ncbi:MAG: GAF domain-containing protein [Archangium sp.]|nr:GAF domain-containing protein [Archangium sp.]